MLTNWERRNEEITSIRDNLRKNATNLELADRYWTALGSYKSGQYVIEAYGEAALASSAGASALARAYQQLFLDSGEAPRKAYFNESLIKALQRYLSELSDEDHAAVLWVLQSVGVNTTLDAP